MISTLIGLIIFLAHCSDQPVEIPPTPFIQKPPLSKNGAMASAPNVPEPTPTATNKIFISVVKTARPAVVNIVAMTKNLERSSPTHQFFNDPFFWR